MIEFQWDLDDEGGGKLTVFVYERDGLREGIHYFDSLDELPPNIAKAIRDDGRRYGEFPPEYEE